jgi:hypothetical protein
VGEAWLDGYREDPPRWGRCVKHSGVRYLDHEDNGARQRRGQAGCNQASLRVVALNSKNGFAHSLLVRGRHVLEVHNATLGSPCAHLLELLQVPLVVLGGAPDDGMISSARAHDFLILHPRMVATTSKALQWPAFAAVVAVVAAAAVAGEGLLSLAGISCGIVADNIGVKPLAQKATGNLLHSFHLVLSSLSGGKDNGQLLALDGAVQVMDGRMLE